MLRGVRGSLIGPVADCSFAGEDDLNTAFEISDHIIGVRIGMILWSQWVTMRNNTELRRK